MHHNGDKKVHAAVEAARHEYMRSLVDAPAPKAAVDFASLLEDAGFGAGIEVETAFKSMCQRVFNSQSDETAAINITRALLATPSPASALLNLERYFERAGDPTVFLTTIAGAPPILEMVAVALGGSQYMADIIVRNPNLVYWLMEPGTWATDDDTAHYVEWFEREAALFTRFDGKLGALHRAHRQALLKTGLLDMLGQASIEDTTSRLSRIADAIATVVLALVRESLRGDRAHAPAELAVIAMGKLGGHELNYSSDIDLVYVCADTDDETVAFHTKVARRFGEALSELTAEGYFYRVDLRLRPDGKAGPLVNTETSMRLYYENRGRPWEFQAMLKARTVAGDRDVGTRFLDAVGKLVYSTSLPYSPLESIATMRQQIVDGIPAHERGLNIKLMSGGIRDVEFIVQTLQLLHGPAQPELRTGNTLEGLAQISRYRLLDRLQIDNLEAGYRFFRLVEHRLQMMHQLKTHTVPESQEEVALLAQRVRWGPIEDFDPGTFLSTLSRHLGNIRMISESFFAGESVDPRVALLMLAEDDPRSGEILRRYGIDDVGRAMRTLHEMAYGSFPRLLDRSARKAFEKLLPLVLSEVSQMGDPVQALIHLAGISRAGNSESAFYTTLIDSTPARDLVFGIAGFSSILTRRICNQIETLDTLMRTKDDASFREQFEEIPEWDRFNADLARKGGPAAGERQQRQRDWFDRARLHTFALAYRSRFRSNILGSVRAWSTARQVSLAFDSVFGETPGVALFVVGSYAVEEPRMSSDLDLIVVTDDADVVAVTDGVQLLNRWFTEGNILKLDFRLRGEGASAPLVQDVSFYRSYFNNRISLWERIALSKCRAWWGSAQTQESFVHALRSCVAKPFQKSELHSLAEMRKRLETLAPKKFNAWDTKRAAGGRYDIEYLTAIGMATCATNAPDFFAMTTADRLDRLAQKGLISAGQSDLCRRALETFSVVEYLMELQSLVHPGSIEKHEYLSHYLDCSFEYLEIDASGGVERMLVDARANVRDVYEHVMTDLCAD